MAERGIIVDHSTINRWVQHAPELDKRIRPHLRPTNSWRVDETYIRLKDSGSTCTERLIQGQYSGLSAQCQTRRCCGRAVSKRSGRHTQTPKWSTWIRMPPIRLLLMLKADEQLSETTELRLVLYLNNQVEQDHRFIKRLTKPGMGFASFSALAFVAEEAMNMIRKGQIKALTKAMCEHK